MVEVVSVKSTQEISWEIALDSTAKMKLSFENDIFEGEVVNVDALKDLIGKLPTKMVNSFKKD